MEVKPIAIFKTRKKNPYEAARQGTAESSDEVGEIHFQTGQMFEQALDDIEVFSHLWVLFQFHLNDNWKPKVLPPRGSDHKVGVFATRSPYRPNPLGLSCVELVERRGLILKVKNFDLLDQTPIFDIKPYIAYADSFPGAHMGWLESIEKEKFEISLTANAQNEINFLQSQGLSELFNFLIQQLSFDPLNGSKKRVHTTDSGTAILAYRTWRIEFQMKDRLVQILRFFSGYSTMELEDPSDPYQDKDLHRQFIEWKDSSPLDSP